MSKKTPLYPLHLKHKGKLIDFFGFTLPIQYEHGILHEHLHVRKHVGLFDVSHMGEFFIEGQDALAIMEHLFTVNVSKQKDGSVRYGFLCNHQGNVIDDALIYKYSNEKFLIVVNAANIEKNEAWIKANLTNSDAFTNQSDAYGLIAVQGPSATSLMLEVCDQLPKQKNTFLDKVVCADKNVMVSKTGYTGEIGYEIYCDQHDAITIFEALYAYQEKHKVTLCGLGARDTLRLEAGMPLYGHELSENISPIDVGLSVFLKDSKHPYIGHQHHQRQPQLKRIGLELIDKGIARENYRVYQNEKQVGTISSGTFSPSLAKGIAMAIVDIDVDENQPVDIAIRNKLVRAQIVALPFNYRKGESEHDR
jgi:aminomethyltransferase